MNSLLLYCRGNFQRMILTRQCNMSYSRGNYTQAITVVRRSKYFKMTMAPTLAGFVTTGSFPWDYMKIMPFTITHAIWMN
jgi:hypothetical protein